MIQPEALRLANGASVQNRDRPGPVLSHVDCRLVMGIFKSAIAQEMFDSIERLAYLIATILSVEAIITGIIKRIVHVRLD